MTYKIIGVVILVSNDDETYHKLLESLKTSTVIAYESKEGPKDLSAEEATAEWRAITSRTVVLEAPT